MMIPDNDDDVMGVEGTILRSDLIFCFGWRSNGLVTSGVFTSLICVQYY